jgi:radical SAM protein with 4Fe4S-binding SPASM domain
VALGLETRIVLKILYAKPQWHISRFWNLEGIIRDTERAEALFEGFRSDLQHIARRHGIPLNLAAGRFAETIRTLDECGYNSIDFQDILPGITVQLTNLHPVFHTDMMVLNRERAHLFTTVPPARMDCTLTQLPYVTATGDVYPCPSNLFDPRDAQELCLGNVRDTSLAEILNGTRYNDFFRRSITGALDFAVCRKCKTRYRLKETHD